MAEERNRRTAHLDLTENELKEVLQAGLLSRGIEGNVSDIRVRMVQSENDLFPVADGISCSMQLKPVWNKIADYLRDNPSQTAVKIAFELNLPDKLVMRVIKTMVENGEVKRETKNRTKRKGDDDVETKWLEGVYSLNERQSGLQDILSIRWTV